MTRHHSKDSLPALILANYSILFILCIPMAVSNQSPWTAIHNFSNPWAFPTQHQRITLTILTAMLPHQLILPTIADLLHSMNPDCPPSATVICLKSRHNNPTISTAATTTTKDHNSSNSSHWQIPIPLFLPLKTLFQCFETEWHSHHPPPCTTIRKLGRNSEWSHSCSSKPTILLHQQQPPQLHLFYIDFLLSHSFFNLFVISFFSSYLLNSCSFFSILFTKCYSNNKKISVNHWNESWW